MSGGTQAIESVIVAKHKDNVRRIVWRRGSIDEGVAEQTGDRCDGEPLFGTREAIDLVASIH